jgi:hypothetical protein
MLPVAHFVVAEFVTALRKVNWFPRPDVLRREVWNVL